MWSTKTKVVASDYPRRTIVRDGNVQITRLAVAGWSVDEMKVELIHDAGNSVLVVKGDAEEKVLGGVVIENNLRQSEFESRTVIAGNASLKSADMKDGVLTIVTERFDYTNQGIAISVG